MHVNLLLTLGMALVALYSWRNASTMRLALRIAAGQVQRPARALPDPQHMLLAKYLTEREAASYVGSQRAMALCAVAVVTLMFVQTGFTSSAALRFGVNSALIGAVISAFLIVAYDLRLNRLARRRVSTLRN
jgi:hypothetical protein